LLLRAGATFSTSRQPEEIPATAVAHPQQCVSGQRGSRHPGAIKAGFDVLVRWSTALAECPNNPSVQAGKR
jgi:hypothetical protein